VTEDLSVINTPEASDLVAEMRRQLKRWGRQSHPNGTSADHREACDRARAECDEADRNGGVTWLHILNEEFLEAASEVDEHRLEAELIQVMAVCGSWLRDLREKRRALEPREPWRRVGAGDRVTVDSGLNDGTPVTGTALFVNELLLILKPDDEDGRSRAQRTYQWEDVAELTVHRGRDYRED
jgi:hypothetical protein